MLFFFHCFIYNYFTHICFEGRSFTIQTMLETINGNRVVGNNDTIFILQHFCSEHYFHMQLTHNNVGYFLRILYIYYLISFTFKPI